MQNLGKIGNFFLHLLAHQKKNKKNKPPSRKLSFVVYKLSAMEAVEYRSVIKFPHLKGQTSTEIHQQMVAVYTEKCPNYSTVTHWVSGHLFVLLDI